MKPTTPILHIALVEPDIAPNVGTIARFCAANGIRLHLIGKLGFRLTDKALRRAGLDYWEHVDLHEHVSWIAFREHYPSMRCHSLSAKARVSYVDVAFKHGDCLILGSETSGLSSGFLDGSLGVQVCTIPMLNRAVRCLNVAMAAGIVASEALRQIRLTGSTLPTDHSI